MKIGGLQKVTLIDFPAHLAAIVFVKNCNFRCPFCFNRELVLGNLPTISQASVLAFLKKRRGILDGVVVTGGEPLIHSGLEDFLKKVKKVGYKIKIDTNGYSPKVLKSLIKGKLVDYVALDIKGPLDQQYGEIIGKKDFDVKTIESSLKILLKSGVPFELRTTVVPGIHDREVLTKMARQLKQLTRGLRKPVWYWQNFQPKNCLDPEFEKVKPYSQRNLNKLLNNVKKIIAWVDLRNE
jgi:pyruvate formate lyase activating enzyme